MTQSEFATLQFYNWELRGRGYYLFTDSVLLEPPFIPFFHQKYHHQRDDGKRPTLVSSFLDRFKKSKLPGIENHTVLTYENVEPFRQIGVSVLEVLRIYMPKDRKWLTDQSVRLLTILSATIEALSFELIGTSTEYILQYTGTAFDIDMVESQVQAFYPTIVTKRDSTGLANILLEDIQTISVDYGLNEEFVRPIGQNKPSIIDTLTAFFGVLDRLKDTERCGIQILFHGVVNNWRDSIIRSVTGSTGTSFFIDAPEAPKLAQEKIQTPLFAVAIRSFAQASSDSVRYRLHTQIVQAITSISDGMYNSLIPLPTAEYSGQERIDDIYLRQSRRLGMLLNANELSLFVHFPNDTIQSKKLVGSTKKTVETPTNAQGKEFVLGVNRHNNETNPVSIGLTDRLKHTHILGATGTGKSTLITQLLLQDINQGLGVALFDPHGDLIQDVIERLPTERLKDVILIDPSDTDFPIGINILQAHSDIEKEILASDLVASFRKLSTSWGDQMNAVFGNAVLAMLESSETVTLTDLRRFLVESSFRQDFLQTVQDPSIRYYWLKEYPLLKTNSIGPILTRLDSFLRPKTIRNMVLQKEGLDFTDIIGNNKILLLKLSQGLIGTENSHILGSLFLSKIHQAILARQATSHRTPFFIYLDEFQHFITPSIKEMLSGVRKYKAGLIVTHQDLLQIQQSDSETLNSLLNNVNNRIVFRVGEQDAKRLQEGFLHFDHTDLQNLGVGEVIIKIEQPQYDCAIETAMLSVVNKEIAEELQVLVKQNTQRKYAKQRVDVENEILNSLHIEAKTVVLPKQEKVKKVVEVGKIEQKQTVEYIEPIEIAKPIEAKKVNEEKSSQVATKGETVHRYLQNLIKKLGESKGYIATIEKAIPNGSIDVELTKDSTKIAIEISVTTEVDWEVHNIIKCLPLNYTTIISVCGDKKQLDKTEAKCKKDIPSFDTYHILFLTPDMLFHYLEEQKPIEEAMPSEVQVIKGYRVNVSYTTNSMDKDEVKKKSISNLVMKGMRKKGK